MTLDPKEFNLPEALYFDTNMLLHLPYWSSNVEFIELRESAKRLKAGFFVPEVVARELAQRRKEDAEQQLNKLKGLSQSLGKLLKREPLDYEQIDRVDATIDSLTTEFLDYIGVQVVPTPTDIPLKALIEMAVRRKAPFQGIGEKGERGDKGFKDTIILFTLTEHMRNNEFKDGVFLAHDKIFQERNVSKIIYEAGLNIVIHKSLKEATEHIKSKIDSLVERHIQEEKSKIKSFLSARFNEISDYVISNAQISERFLKPFGLAAALVKGDKLDNCTIKKILSIKPKEISNVFTGHMNKDDAREKGVIPITFSVSIKFDLLVEPYLFQIGLFSDLSEKFPLSAPDDFEKIMQEPRLLRPRETEEKTVYRDITIEASIVQENNEYKDLRLSKIYDF